MGCHQCWTEVYKQYKKSYIADRIKRGNGVRKKTIEPMLCPCCKQPTNSRNEAEEVYNAKRLA